MAISKEKIVAYAFDSIGYGVEDGLTLDSDFEEITFISHKNRTPIDIFNGIIFPSGVFEKFEKHDYSSVDACVEVHCYRDILLKRERELINLVNKGGWICSLIGKIIDEVPYGLYKTKKCDDTDLAKFLLNDFKIKRQAFKGTPGVISKNDEFNFYIRKWGIAKTILDLYGTSQDGKILAEADDFIVGIEFYGSCIFLPFHSIDFTKENAESLVKELCRAIRDYRKKRITLLPDWLDEFKFEKEERLREQLTNHLSKAKSIEKDLSKVKYYKGILTQSGEALKDNVINILRDYFNFNVTDEEDFKEDAVIRNEDGQALSVVEIKGTKGGIKRRYINQLDTNRERIGLFASTPGILIINDQLTVEGITERSETTVAAEQILHARKMNILILRTIDLLFLMRLLEKDDDPGKKLIDLLNGGGGRLVVDDNIAKIIT